MAAAGSAYYIWFIKTHLDDVIAAFIRPLCCEVLVSTERKIETETGCEVELKPDGI